MELPEIVIGAILTVFIPGALYWANSLQKELAKLETKVEVNTSRDDQMWNHVAKMEDKLEKILEEIGSIKEYIAHQKGKG